MLRTRLAKRVLSHKEQAHLTEMGIHNMAGMRRQLDHQRRTNPKRPAMVCWECWMIGLKLGLRQRKGG